MSKNDERRFRITYFEEWCNEYFNLSRKIEKGSIVTDNELCNYYKSNSLDIPSVINIEDFNRQFVTQIEEIFDENDSNKECTINELEEGIEYLDTIYGHSYKMIENKLFYRNKDYTEDCFTSSGVGYNQVNTMKFTKVQPTKKYTFDEAKKDCEENVTIYVEKYSNDKIDESAVQMYNVNGHVWFKVPDGTEVFSLTERTTWIKKSDLDR